MKQEQLQAIRERVNKATPGPWTCDRLEVHGDKLVVVPDKHNRTIESVEGETVVGNYHGCVGRENAEFIAYAREDVPALLDEIERLRTELQHIAHATTVAAANKWARQALAGESV